jgi:hypothetical protein
MLVEDRYKEERLTSYDKDSTETLEIGESTRVMPVFGTEVTLIAYTTTVDDDTEDNETQTSSNLDSRQNKFDWRG